MCVSLGVFVCACVSVYFLFIFVCVCGFLGVLVGGFVGVCWCLCVSVF